MTSALIFKGFCPTRTGLLMHHWLTVQRSVERGRQMKTNPHPVIIAKTNRCLRLSRPLPYLIHIASLASGERVHSTTAEHLFKQCIPLSECVIDGEPLKHFSGA